MSGEMTGQQRQIWIDYKAVDDMGAELAIPLRLLAAAVEWKRTQNIRALLALPIEERRILESLLPASNDVNAPRGNSQP
jgi:hypothetical protein